MNIPSTVMSDFGTALKLLIKDGKKVARKGWNGKNMWLAVQKGSVVGGENARGGVAKILAEEGFEKIVIADHIDMKTTNGNISVGWTPSQEDLFAEDWIVVE